MVNFLVTRRISSTGPTKNTTRKNVTRTTGGNA